ncbi:MAG: cytochrome c, partial [Candidatus Zixiibacteriota bacterium]
MSTMAQDTPEFFRLNCSSCHWIGGGRLIGPDLKNVTERKEREWLVEFIQNPQAKIDAGDPYALQLKAEAKGVVMLTIPGMTGQRAEALLSFIEEQSKLEKSIFAGKKISTEAFTEAEVERGGQLFAGAKRLSNGGPPCISCHTYTRAGPNVGGSLGPDLAGALERLQGKDAMAAWMTAPPTTTMKSVFKDHELETDEIRSLLALFESKRENFINSQDESIIWMSVLFYGLGGAVVMLLLFDMVWSRRFRAVRRP